jgi:chemotaxis-related protein WspD
MNAAAPTSEQVLEILLQNAASRSFSAGAVLIEEGRSADAVYYIVKGRVSIVRNDVEINTQGEGCIVGEMGVLLGQARNASVICATDVEALQVEGADFLKVIEEFPVFMRSVFKDMVGKLQATPGLPAALDATRTWTAESRNLGSAKLLQILTQRQQAARRPCWQRIGVWGDSSCPELAAAVHCRNCHVFAAGGRGLLERRPPPDYLNDWTQSLAKAKDAADKDIASVVIFRLGGEWLALRARIFHEITRLGPIHSLPHRANNVILGLTNIRGELLLCFSLARLLGVADGGAAPALTRRVYQRVAVTEMDRQRCAFPMDEVLGIQQVPGSARLNTPVTVAKSSSSYSAGVFQFQGVAVELLDHELLFYSLKKNHL